jgi:hypothetical protein
VLVWVSSPPPSPLAVFITSYRARKSIVAQPPRNDTDCHQCLQSLLRASFTPSRMPSRNGHCRKVRVWRWACRPCSTARLLQAPDKSEVDWRHGWRVLPAVLLPLHSASENSRNVRWEGSCCGGRAVERHASRCGHDIACSYRHGKAGIRTTRSR